jgi:hypothetical protein
LKRLAKLSLIIIVCTLTLTMVFKVRAEVEGGNVKTFFDSEIPGIKIQANATAETRPTENLTVWLHLVPQTNVYVELFRLDVYGFQNGTAKVSIGNISDYNFPLNGTAREYSWTFPVQDGVWGVTFAEITLTYSASLGGLELRFPNATSGFYNQLNGTYNNLTGEYLQLNQTFVQLQQNYTTLQGSMNELENTRRVAVILAITTVFFVATTIFMVMRRPRESW